MEKRSALRHADRQSGHFLKSMHLISRLWKRSSVLTWETASASICCSPTLLYCIALPVMSNPRTGVRGRLGRVKFVWTSFRPVKAPFAPFPNADKAATSHTAAVLYSTHHPVE